MGNSKKLIPWLTSLFVWFSYLLFFQSLKQNSARGENVLNEHFPPLSLDIKNSSTSPTSQAGLSLPLRTPPAVEKFIKFYDLPKSVLLIRLTKATNLANHHVCHQALLVNECYLGFVVTVNQGLVGSYHCFCWTYRNK